VSFPHHLRISAAAFLLLLFATSAGASCPECQDEKCIPLTNTCACVPKIGCTLSIPIPGTTKPGSVVPDSPIPLPPPIQTQVDKWDKEASRTVEKLGDDTLTTFQKAGGDTLRTLQKAGGDTFASIQKAGDDSVETIYKAAGDASATYVKAWRDVGNQAKTSFDDAVDAGKAAARYVENQAKSQIEAGKNAGKRLSEGKVVDSMWGLATEPLQSTEKNFAQATQQSKVINAAAGTAAAVYGGPAGAAAYAAWSTYRSTGNADMALRAGVLAAVTSQMGASVAQMPAGTSGEIIKKAAMAGAAGGISVAAAGGDEQAIKDGFLKSAGAVLVQGGSQQLKNYSPTAKDAYDTVQCISARDVDCLSNTTWARDAKGKILYDEDGKPKIDTSKLDPNQYIGKWTGVDPQSDEGKKNAFITQISKLPKMEAIPVLKNQWTLTWTLGKDQNIAHGTPTVVLTFVGADAPFTSTVKYEAVASSDAVVPDVALGQGKDLFSTIHVSYYEKPADGNRIRDALEHASIPYMQRDYIGPKHERALSNALICGPDTPVEAVKKVALTLMSAGVDIKYIGTKKSYEPRQIVILNLLKHRYTVNYPNLTPNQIAGLSECPSALKNKN
jgi:hypothetical protein